MKYLLNVLSGKNFNNYAWILVSHGEHHSGTGQQWIAGKSKQEQSSFKPENVNGDVKKKRDSMCYVALHIFH